MWKTAKFVFADQSGAMHMAVCLRNFKFIRAMHDVAVGENETIRSDDKT